MKGYLMNTVGDFARFCYKDNVILEKEFCPLKYIFTNNYSVFVKLTFLISGVLTHAHQPKGTGYPQKDKNELHCYKKHKILT